MDKLNFMTPVLHILLMIFLTLYAVFTLITWLGLLKPAKMGGRENPFVSVIVVARNEEKHLPRCLESLGRLDYPPGKLEWILVDDRSTDGTNGMMRSFAKGKKWARVISIRISPEGVTGKTNGLIQGAKAARGEVLFFTDGDCIVPNAWIQTSLRYFESDTGIVSGFLVLDRKGEPSPVFARLQSLDWMYINSIGCGWANLGLPLSAFGNNLSIRKNAYQKAGGFESAKNHLIEDFALTRNVMRTGLFHIRIVLDPQNAVQTRPAGTLLDFADQRRRWAMGGRNHGAIAWLMMGTAYLMHFIVLLNLLAGQWNAGFTGFLCALLLDTLLLFRPLRILGRLDLVKYLPLYELFYFSYSLAVAPVFLFSKKVKWKSGIYHAEK